MSRNKNNLPFLGPISYLIGKISAGQNFRRTKLFGGQNFRQQVRFLAILSAEILSDLVIADFSKKISIISAILIMTSFLTAKKICTYFYWKSKVCSYAFRPCIVRLGHFQRLDQKTTLNTDKNR